MANQAKTTTVGKYGVPADVVPMLPGWQLKHLQELTQVRQSALATRAPDGRMTYEEEMGYQRRYAKGAKLCEKLAQWLIDQAYEGPLPCVALVMASEDVAHVGNFLASQRHRVAKRGVAS